MKLFYFSKKPTYGQHDNEKLNYYQCSSPKINIQNELRDNLKVDICVIGGGLTGISSALYLAKKGYKVVVLEARKIGWGAQGEMEVS